MNVVHAVLHAMQGDTNLSFTVGHQDPFFPKWTVEFIGLRLHDTGRNFDPTRDMLCVDIVDGEGGYKTHNIELENVLLITYED